MTSAFVTFAASLVTAAALTPWVLRWARRRRLFDSPDERKVHVQPIPRLGGIAIVIAFFVPLSGLLLVRAGISHQLWNLGNQLIGFYVGGLLIAAIGLYDDLRGANARQKLVVQVSVAVLMYLLGFRIDNISSPFGGVLELGILSAPVTILWFVGVMNAVNLIDGLDGLAGGIGFISVATLLVLSVLNQNPLAVLMSAGLAGALGGFLIYNFNPARIFMGDTGSLFLGFILAALSISTSQKGSTTVAIAVPLLVLGLPILDTAMAIGRRIRRRRPIFSADQDHIHHKLLRAGFSHRGAVLALYAVTLMLAVAAIAIRFMSTPAAGAVVVAAALALVAILVHLTRRVPSPRVLADPFGVTGLASRARVDRLNAALDAIQGAQTLGELLDTFVGDTRVAALAIDDGQRPIYAFIRPTTTQEQLHPLVRYRLPLAERSVGKGHAHVSAHLTLHFFQHPEADNNLAVILPWERVAPALTRALTRLDWARLQREIPALDDAPLPTADVAATFHTRLAGLLTGRHNRPTSHTT
jgi:UDP-N-acetylmuramyl pentapeptide phosphotransferase/UDP-N-acetylglucosamine-1-phosphate transferase